LLGLPNAPRNIFPNLSFKNSRNVDYISFIELFGRIRVVFHKIRYLYLRWSFFCINHSWINSLLKKNENKIARSFNFTFRYIDYVLSLNNSRFGDFVDPSIPLSCS
jgi:hypothetical protein